MNEIFKKEWELYRQNGTWSHFRGMEKRVCANGFDEPVAVGEIRIFADMNRPFVALVVESRGAFGYRLVPVSPFTVPASARELLVGERVYQLWNACTAAKPFVERSWRVETLAAAEVAEIGAAARAVPVGAISRDATACAYEREFRVAGGNFRFGTECAAGGATHWWRGRVGWSIAAMLMVCCGVFGLWFEEQRQACRMAEGAERTRREMAYRAGLMVGSAEEECESEVMEEGCEPVEAVDVSVGAPASAPASVAPAAPEVIALIKSPVTMRSMAGSRRSRGGSVAAYTPPVAPLAASYAEYVENEFKDPQTDPLSTFSLDVDTSSYTMMRRCLQEYHRHPQAEAVRLEDYVNYFKYDYPQPTGKDPIAVDCELADCPWNPAHKLLRLGVQARKVEADKLPPCNLTFLIDVSGSMSGEDRIGLVQKGLKLLVGQLRDEDHVAIVTYANNTQVRLPSISGREKAAINEVIDGLVAFGGTAGGKGIQLAYAEAQKHFDRKANNRVILVTDGDFNIGISTPEELEGFITGKRKSGVFLTVLGVGFGNYRDANMKKLASAGNGNYAYLDSMLEAKKVMMNEFGGTLQTVAKDVKVQIEFNPSEVAAYRLLGYENRMLKARDFKDDKKDAGEIGSGHTMTAFYEIEPTKGGAKGAAGETLKYQKNVAVASEELFTVKMRYKQPDGEKSILVEKAHKAADITRKEPSEDFRFASAVAEFALVLENSKFKGEASFKAILDRARNAKGKDEEGYRAEFIRLVEAAELIHIPAPRREEPSRGKEPSVDVDVDI